MSNIVGLLLYELDYRNGFELDSNNNIKYASSLDTVKEEEVQKTQPAVDKTPAPKERPSTNPLETIQDIGAIKEKNKKSEKGLFNSLIDKFTRWI
jgi:hypothetical protein